MADFQEPGVNAPEQTQGSDAASQTQQQASGPATAQGTPPGATPDTQTPVSPLKFTAPSGRVYTWTKPTPPTQQDLDAMKAHEESLTAGEQVASPSSPGIEAVKNPLSGPIGPAPKKGPGAPFAGAITAAEQKYGLPAGVLDAILRTESNYNPGAYNASSGATGIAQFMPGTAKGLGIDPTDPNQSIDGAGRYLRTLINQFGGNVKNAVAAYNAGPGNVTKYGGVPPFPETQAYVQKVLGGLPQGGDDGTQKKIARLQAIEPIIQRLESQGGDTGNLRAEQAQLYEDLKRDPASLAMARLKQLPPATATQQQAPPNESDADRRLRLHVESLALLPELQSGTSSLDTFRNTLDQSAASLKRDSQSFGQFVQAKNAQLQALASDHAAQQAQTSKQLSDAAAQVDRSDQASVDQYNKLVAKAAQEDSARVADFAQLKADAEAQVKAKQQRLAERNDSLQQTQNQYNALLAQHQARIDRFNQVAGALNEYAKGDAQSAAIQNQKDAFASKEQQFANAAISSNPANKYAIAKTFNMRLAAWNPSWQSSAEPYGQAAATGQPVAPPQYGPAMPQKAQASLEGVFHPGYSDAHQATMPLGAGGEDQDPDVTVLQAHLAALKSGDPSKVKAANKLAESQYGLGSGMQGAQALQYIASIPQKIVPMIHMAANLTSTALGNGDIDKGIWEHDPLVKTGVEFADRMKWFLPPVALAGAVGLAQSAQKDPLGTTVQVLRQFNPGEAGITTPERLQRALNVLLAGMTLTSGAEKFNAAALTRQIENSGVDLSPGLPSNQFRGQGDYQAKAGQGFGYDTTPTEQVPVTAEQLVNAARQYVRKGNIVANGAVKGWLLNLADTFTNRQTGDLARYSASKISNPSADIPMYPGKPASEFAGELPESEFSKTKGAGATERAQEEARARTGPAAPGTQQLPAPTQGTPATYGSAPEPPTVTPSEPTPPVGGGSGGATPKPPKDFPTLLTGGKPVGLMEQDMADAKQGGKPVMTADRAAPTGWIQFDSPKYSFLVRQDGQGGMTGHVFDGEPGKRSADATKFAQLNPATEPQVSGPKTKQTEPSEPKTPVAAPSMVPDSGENKPHPHKFSSTQLNLGKADAQKIQDLSNALIPDRALHIDPNDPSYGRETTPHITVKYGIHSVVPDDVQKALEGHGPITVTLGKTSVFPATEDHPYDVVKVEVHSPELHALNAKVAASTPNTDTYPTYQPHITLAYVKRGQGAKYAHNSQFEGQKITFNSLAFSSKNGKVTNIPLGKPSEPEKPSTKEPWQMTVREFGDSKGQGHFLENDVSRTQKALDQELRKWEKLEAEGADVAHHVQRFRLRNQLLAEHKASVAQAVSEGKPVPSEVLKDYPNIAKSETEQPKTETAPSPAPQTKSPKAIAHPNDHKIFAVVKGDRSYVRDEEGPNKGGVTRFGTLEAAERHIESPYNREALGLPKATQQEIDDYEAKHRQAQPESKPTQSKPEPPKETKALNLDTATPQEIADFWNQEDEPESQPTPKPPAPVAQPPKPKPAKRELASIDDLNELLGKLKQGLPVLVDNSSGASTGLPTIQAFGDLGNTEMLGFGMFVTKGPGWSATWEGGSAMDHTAGNISYTTVQATGTIPYDIPQRMREIEGRIAAQTPKPKKEGAPKTPKAVAPASAKDEARRLADDLWGPGSIGEHTDWSYQGAPQHGGGQTQTPEFKKWFGDSKVVNPDGTPMVVYHGTDAEFERFSRKLAGSTTSANSDRTGVTSAKLGHWFSESPAVVEQTASAVGMPVFLSIQNPFILPNSSGYDIGSWVEYYHGGSATKARKWLINEGYDGIHLPDDREFGAGSWVGFSATQIKSAIGNNGQFDPNNPSIVADRPRYRPGSNEKQKAAAVDAMREIKGVPGSVVAMQISHEWKTSTGAVLINKRVRSAADLAAISQCLRSGTHETFRVVFVKNKKVIQHDAYSSRLPASSAIFVRDISAYAAWLKDEMAANGADGFYVMHNHPSGTSLPSFQDRAVTKRIHDELGPVFLGHLIIDFNNYTFLDPNAESAGYGGSVKTVDRQFFKGDDPVLRPAVASPILGESIESDEDIAKIAATLKLDSQHVALIGVSAQGRVKLVTQIPVSTLWGTKTLTRSMAILTRTARKTGSATMFLYLPEEPSPEAQAALLEAIRHDVLTDAVYPYPNSALSRFASVRWRATSFTGRVLGHKPEQATRVAEGDVDPVIYARFKPIFEKSYAENKGDLAGFRKDMKEALGPHFQRALPYVIQFAMEVQARAKDNTEHENNGTTETSDVRGSGQNLPAGESSEDVPTPSGLGATEPSAISNGEPSGGNDGEDAGSGGDLGPGIRGGEQTSTPTTGTPGNGATGGGTRTGRNYRVTLPEEQGETTLSEKKADLIAALETLKRVEASGKPPKDADRKILARFPGWGWLGNTMNPKTSKDPVLRDKIKSLLTKEELNIGAGIAGSMDESLLTSHYTSGMIIEQLWSAAKRLGFKGGTVLENSAGKGLFLGMAPKLPIDWTAVELDPITGRILQMLYPEADVRIAGFQYANIPPDAFDLNIGNYPFGGDDSQIADLDIEKKYGRGATSRIHNYFAVKSLESVKPGGLVIAVTTKGSLDAMGREGMQARVAMAAQADLLGAIRLPNTAFSKNAGTAVTTDILFFRKRLPGENPNGEAFLSSAPVATREGVTMMVNEYFAKHPEMVLGSHSNSGSMYRKGEYTLLFPNQADYEKITGKTDQFDVSNKEAAMRTLLEAAIARLPKNVFGASEGKVKALTDRGPQPPSGVRTGGMFPSEGQWYVATGPVTSERMELGKKEQAVARHYLPIKDALLRLLELQAATDDDSVLAPLQEELKRAYLEFVAKTPGRLYEQTARRLIIQDPDGPTVLSLENTSKDDKGKIVFHGLADVFTKRVIKFSRTVTHAATADDALLASMVNTGRVSIDEMAKLAGMSEDEVKANLKGVIFYDPSAKEWVTADEYGSGNVVLKLQQAKELAQENSDEWKGHVEFLESKQPAPVYIEDISAPLGASWVPTEAYEAFTEHLLGERMRIRKVAATGDIIASGGPWRHALDTSRMKARDILEKVFSHQAINVYDRERDGTTVKNEEATIEARARAEEFNDRWDEFMRSDKATVDKIEAAYAQSVNCYALRKFDGTHLTLPGTTLEIKGKPFKPYDHQLNVIWRILQRPVTMMAHGVGSGKTISIVGAAMELRRTGLRNKSCIVVYNGTEGQYQATFRSMYPNSKVLVLDAAAMDKKKRRATLAKIATGNWDAIVVPHSIFKRVSPSPAMLEAYYQEQIDALKEALYEAGGDDGMLEEGGTTRGADPTVKQIVRTIKNLKGRLDRIRAKIASDNNPGPYWEHMGIDQIFVDESHEYKNLPYGSKMVGMGAPGSGRAADLELKIQSTLRQGGGAVLASGTPVANSIAEAYFIFRYLIPTQLKAMGIVNFDTWSDTYAKAEIKTERTVSGSFKEKERLRKFFNLPELKRILRDVSDVVHTQELAALGRITLPKLGDAAGKVTDGSIAVESKPSNRQKQGFIELKHRAEAIAARTGPPQPGDDILLSVSTDGRLMSMDMRLIDPTAEDHPESKVNQCVDNVARIYHNPEYAKEKAAQVIFLDMGTPKNTAKPPADLIFRGLDDMDDVQKAIEKLDEKNYEPIISQNDDGTYDVVPDLNESFNLYADIKNKLIKKGVTAHEIAFMHDANNPEQKMRLMGKVNTGEIRVLLTSTLKGGVGVNIQERLIASHQLDPTWRPCDMEQRLGRIVRQGNMWDVVQDYQYVNVGTFDAFMWNKLSQKQLIITQLWDESFDVREAEDISGDATFDPKLIEAIAQGNPEILEYEQLKEDVRKLETAERAYRNQQSRLRREIDWARQQIPQTERRIDQLKAFQEQVLSQEPDPYKITIDGKDYDNRKEAGAALINTVKRIVADDIETAPPTPKNAKSAPHFTDHTIGRYGPFDIHMGTIANTTGMWLVAPDSEIDGKPWVSSATREMESLMSLDAEDEPNYYVPTANRVTKMLPSFEADITQAKRNIREYQRTVDESEKELGKPWPKATFLKHAQERFAELDETIGAAIRSGKYGQWGDADQDEEVQPPPLTAPILIKPRVVIPGARPAKTPGDLPRWFTPSGDEPQIGQTVTTRQMKAYGSSWSNITDELERLGPDEGGLYENTGLKVFRGYFKTTDGKGNPVDVPIFVAKLPTGRQIYLGPEREEGEAWPRDESLESEAEAQVSRMDNAPLDVGRIIEPPNGTGDTFDILGVRAGKIQVHPDTRNVDERAEFTRKEVTDMGYRLSDNLMNDDYGMDSVEEDIDPDYMAAPGAPPAPAPGPAPAPTTPPLAPTGAPTVTRQALNVAQFMRPFQNAFAPESVSLAALDMSLVIREHGGLMAREAAQAEHQVSAARLYFDRRSKDYGWDWVNQIETGTVPKDGSVRSEWAMKVRKLYDHMTDRLTREGILHTYIDNYFTHMWKDPAKAEAWMQGLGKKPLAGGKNFLKQRSIPTFADGMAAGLVPAADNPIDILLLSLNQMRKCLYAKRLLDQGKAGPFVYAMSGQEPDGYRRINDKLFTVWAPPAVEFKVPHDQVLEEKLMAFAQSLGIPVQWQDSVKLPGKSRGVVFGSAHRLAGIKLKNGVGEYVFSHELGHMLDYRFGLKHLFFHASANAAEIKDEMTRLAALRYEGLTPSASFKRYVNKESEMIANFLHAYIYVPQILRKTAPLALAEFEKLVSANPKLAAVRDLHPSLVIGVKSIDVPTLGPVEVGHYVAPEDVARVINNYLSPGLRRHEADWVRGAYGGLLGLNNTMNQFQLGLSAFHLTTEALNAGISELAIGIAALTTGNIPAAVKHIIGSPIAPFTYASQGKKIIQAYVSSGTLSPQMGAAIMQIAMAGGRAKMDSVYETHARRRVRTAIRDIIHGTAAERLKGSGVGLVSLAPAALEAVSSLIMEVYVPRVKLAAFVRLASYEIGRLGPTATQTETLATLSRAWDSIDNRFGQLVTDNLFWDKTIKDLSHLGLRSFGWKLGTFRELGGAMKDTAGAVSRPLAGAGGGRGALPPGGSTGGGMGAFGFRDAGAPGGLTPRQAYYLAMVIGVGLTGALVGMLLTGRKPRDSRDYFYPPTGRKAADGTDARLSLPSYMKDAYPVWQAFLEGGVRGAIGAEFEQWAKGESPLLQAVGMWHHNKDSQGVRIWNERDSALEQLFGLVSAVGRASMPISLQSSPGDANNNKVARLLGLTPAPASISRSPAENLAKRLIASKFGADGLPEETVKKSQARREILTLLRNGEIDKAQQVAEDSGFKDLLKPVKGKNGAYHIPLAVESQTPGLVESVRHLTLPDAMDVWDVATDAEKAQIANEIWNSKIRNAKDSEAAKEAKNTIGSYIQRQAEEDFDREVKSGKIKLGGKGPDVGGFINGVLEKLGLG